MTPPADLKAEITAGPEPTLDDAAQRQLMDLLDGRLDGVSPQQRSRILSNITDLFLLQSDRAGAQTVELFDDLFLRLIADLDIPALGNLSVALAPLRNAPARTLHLFARHAEAVVAAPVLSESPAIAAEDLAAIAATAGPDQLLAIAARERLDPNLSAILVASGEGTVIDRLLINPGARMTVADFRDALPRATADSRGRVGFRQRAHVLDFAGRMAGRCVSLDMSPGGLKLQIGLGTQLADTFRLELPNIGEIKLDCRIAWRQVAIVGVQFTRPLAELMRDAERH